METADDNYKAVPQLRGTAAHSAIDSNSYSTKKEMITSLPVLSEELGIMGKIDLYKKDKALLIERKYQLKQIFKGQIYQLWGQYFALLEMGYEVREMVFYESSTNQSIPVQLPTEKDKQELIQFISNFKNYKPEDWIHVSPNKCIHCIYCNLCDKTATINVYT